MQTRRRKNQLLIWIGIITLLLSFTVLSMPVSAQELGDEQLTTDIITNKMPGEHFTINVYVWDVEAMYGYNFFLYYNTTVLTAVNYGYYDPFLVEFKSFIDDTAGLVGMGSSMQIGEPTGWYWVGPYAIAWIEFEVDSYGACLLDLSDTAIGNVWGKPIPHTIVDGYFANIEAPHDVAATKVGVSPTRDIQPGGPVSINVTVANQAIYDEDFTLTVKANSTTVGSQSVALPLLQEKIVLFEWDTTGFAFGNYNITAEASVVPGETDTDDNIYTFDDIVIIGTHDIAVKDIVASPTNVKTGESVFINVTLTNQGNFTETFNASTTYGYVEDTPQGVQPPITIDTQQVIPLTAGTTTMVTFEWNTTEVPFGTKKIAFLWVEANVSKTGEPAVPYETKTANNKFTMPGNVTVWLTGPAVSFSYSALPLFEVYEGRTVTFDASASYSEGSVITSYKWDFGDGNITQVADSIIKHVYITNGTYTVKLTIIDDKGAARTLSRPLTVYRRDVAVLSVEPADTQVLQGKSVTIKVIVANQGDRGAEAFNVTLYYGNTVISKKTASVALNANNTINFSWSTSGVSQGTYTLKAVATTVTGETNLANNELASSSTIAIVAHNVAVTAVTPSPTEVEVGGSVSISVTVTNQGNFPEPENFSVTVYYDDTIIQKQNVTSLAPQGSQTLTFNWDTTGVNPGTYTIKAVADKVTDETETGDNTLLGATSVTVKEKAGPPIPTEVIVAAVGIAAIGAAGGSVYFLKRRKSK